MNKNYTHTVIQSVAKNLGNPRLMYPRSFTPFRMTMLAAAMALSFSACQNEEPLDAPVAKDALALMPAETPVSIQAQLQGGFAQGGSRTGTTTNWYASDEIHPTKQNMRFTLLMPGGSSETVLTNQLSSFDQLPQTEPFSTLMLKDFNLTEGNNRCVSRWTSLYVTSNGSDWLFGFARLKANASGQPVLDYGKLGRAYAKVTLVLQDELQQPIAVNQHGILAKLTQAKSSVGAMYTPEGETQGMAFSNIKNGIQTLVSDEEIAKENLGWAVLKNDGMWEHSLSGMCNADGTEYYFGANDNELTAIVFPTPTHVSEDRIYTPIQGGPQLTDAEVLTIEVNEDPDAYGLLTTGKYTLKLKDVKLADGTPLTALESGKHYTLTVTLQHNMKMQATATIGGWDEVSADVDLNDDAAKIPYEYKEADNTYYIYMKEGIVPCLEHKEANHINATVWYKGMTIDIPLAQLAVVSGAETDLAAAIGEKTTILVTGAETDAIKSFINSKTGAFTLLLPNITTIGEQAFYSCFSLASISLPSATAVGKQAFYGCNNLVSVSFPSATTVGELAFFGCTSLASISLPSATAIGKHAFFGCTSFTTLSFGSVITELGYEAFYNVGNGAGNCALTLASEQQHMTNASASSPGTPNGTPVTSADADALETERTWGGYTWKSITIKQ